MLAVVAVDRLVVELLELVVVAAVEMVQHQELAVMVVLT
jgi:hypothetical protein